MRTSGPRAAALLLALLLGAAGRAGGQAGTALEGRVVEAGTGAPVAGAEVAVEGPASASARSGRDGRWSVGGLAAGGYRVRVVRPGFAARERRVALPAAGELVVRLEPAPVALDALVVTAARREQRLADAPVATERVGRREIEETGAADVAAVLSERTGVQLQGGHPSGNGVMLQGLDAQRVLVLVDGQPIIGRISGEVDLSRIPAASVERVEVVKGPQSTLYGTEAMGGVVNVITRTPPERGWNAGARVAVGSQGRMDASAEARGRAGALAYTLDAGRRSTGIAPGVAETSGALAERWDGQAKARWAPDPAFSVEAGGMVLDERQRWRSGQLFLFADNREWNTRLSATASGERHRLVSTLYASEFSHLSRTGTAPAPPAERPGQREVQRLAEGELLYSGDFRAAVVDAGVEVRREGLRSERVDGDRTRWAAEPFVQATLSGERWSLVPGVRLSWNEAWGSYWAPRLAALVRPVPRLALRASAGRGYRVPAFKELYMEFLNVTPALSYSVRGNPGLSPETSENLTAGAEWTGDRFFVRGQLFGNRLKDFIETRLAGDSAGITVYTYDNVARAATAGADAEAGATVAGMRVEAGYAYLWSEDRATGLSLLGRPTHSGRLSVGHDLPLALRARWTGLYTGRTPVERDDETGAVRERDGYLRLDVRLARTLPRGVELSLGADNLFGSRPDGWPGYTGRQLYLGVGWTVAGADRPESPVTP